MMTAIVPKEKAGDAELRAFRDDFAVAKANADDATKHMDFAETATIAHEGMRRTAQAARECGAALKRMHDAGAYVDAYGDWGGLCQALGVRYEHSYWLMKINE